MKAKPTRWHGLKLGDNPPLDGSRETAFVCLHISQGAAGPHRTLQARAERRIEVKFARPRRRKKHITWTFQLSRPRGMQAKKVLDEIGS